MWKKIHIIYLVLATLLTVAMFFCRFATILGPEGAELKIMYYEKLPYLVMLLMLLTAGVCAIFSYKNAFLQARVAILTALLLTGFQIWLGIDFLRFRTEMIFSISAVFPIAGAILNALAARSALFAGMTLQTAKTMINRKKKRR